MSTVTIYGPSDSLQVRKCAAVAGIVQVKFGQSDLTSSNEKKSYFQALSPLNIYPALKTKHGNIVGSNAICDFLASCDPLARLTGNDIYERGVIQGHVETCSNTLEVFLHKREGTGDIEMDTQIKAYLNYLSHIFEHKTFLVGERRSYADVVIAVAVKYAQESGIELPKPVIRWLNTIYSDPVMGETCVLTKATPTAKSPNSDDEDRNTTAGDAVVDAEVTETSYEYIDFDMGHPMLKAIKPASHSKTPAVAKALSEGSINLEDWKRVFSNAKTPEDYESAFKTFWEQYNPEEYTLWKMVYDKYEGEGVVEYLTVNLMNGFIQACGAPVARKTTFGVVIGSGEPGDYNYEAIFLMRGTEMSKWMVEHRSFEYHNFAKIDHSSEEMRKMVEEFWTSEETLFGKHIIQRVEFK